MLGHHPIAGAPLASVPTGGAPAGINADASFLEGADVFAASATLALAASSAARDDHYAAAQVAALIAAAAALRQLDQLDAVAVVVKALDASESRPDDDDRPREALDLFDVAIALITSGVLEAA